WCLLAPLSSLVIRDTLHQIHDTPPKCWLLDSHERFDQGQALQGSEELRQVRDGRRCLGLRNSVEEKLNRHLEGRCHMLQTACAYPTNASLIFLNLLECETKRLSQLLLAPTKHQATHANFIAHLSINRTGCLYAWPMRRGTHAKISLCGLREYSTRSF